MIDITPVKGIIIDKDGNFVKSLRYPSCKTIEEYLKKIAKTHDLKCDTNFKLFHKDEIELLNNSQFCPLPWFA